MLTPAVFFDRVTCRFPARQRAQLAETVALDGVTLEVAPGMLYGVLGPNGAGKTTVLRLICTLLRPSAGRIHILGYSALDHPEVIRRRLGAALGGERSLYWRLTGRQNLLYAGALHDLGPTIVQDRAADLLQLVGLLDRADDLVEEYSTGMRQRLALARALMHDPQLLVLDEPTAGLDPQAALAMRRLLVSLRERRARTIVVATHNLHEAEDLCDTVAILQRGRLIACDTPSALKSRHLTQASHPAGVSLEDVFLALAGRAPDGADVSRDVPPRSDEA